MKKLRITAFILTLLFIAITFISCNAKEPGDSKTGETTAAGNIEGNTGEANTEPVTEPEKVFPHEIENLGGYKFRVLVDMEEGNALNYEDLNVESAIGEVYNDAIYKRNLELIEKFNIGLSSVSTLDITKDVKNIVSSGSDEYNLITPRLNTAWNLIPYCNDLFPVKNLSLSESWYDQNCVKNLSIANKLYIITGDAFMKHYDGIMLLIFNKQMLKEFALPDPYALVNGGKWTLDAMGAMAKDVTKDLDGNSKMDRYDQWGYALQSDVLEGMINAAGLKFMYKDGDDIPYTEPNTERMNSAIDKILSFYNDYSWDCLRDARGANLSAFWVFPEGKALFNGIMLRYIEWQLRSVEFDFGILPFPKLDEGQERYYTSTNAYYTFSYMMPKTASDPEKTAYIFDAMGFYGEKIIKPAYYDLCLKRKYTQDEESIEMLDIIFGSTAYDLGLYANFGNISGSIRTMLEKGANTFISTYEAREAKAITEINKFLAKIEE